MPWLINGVLAAMAVAVTWLLANGWSERSAAGRLEGAAAGGPAVTAAAGLPAPAVGVTPEQLSERTLFRPNRSEEDLTDDGPAAEPDVRLAELELAGIGIIGGDAAAVILMPGRNPVTNPAAKKGEPLRRVFRPGDAIPGTGFILKEVRLDEVMLARGSENSVLKFNRKDPGSQVRSTAAVQAAQVAAQESARRLTAPPAAAPAAPAAPVAAATPGGKNVPPIPAAGAPPAGPAAAEAMPADVAVLKRDEILRRALQTRQRLLLQPQLQNKNPP